MEVPDESTQSAALHNSMDIIAADSALAYVVRLANFICNNQDMDHGILAKDERLAKEVWKDSGIPPKFLPRIIAKVNSELLATVGTGKL